MKFKVNKEIFSKYPGLTIGVVVAEEINNQGANEEIIRLIKQKELEIQDNFQKETLSQNPKINAWRQAYSAFGAKPKKYKCSVENLYRMILEGKEVKHINKIVDIYNYISLKHMIPVGGDDLDKVEGDIELKFADGTENFTELNSKETKNPKPGEVIYSDEKNVLCRRWNWRECDKTKMTEDTNNVCLVVEALPPFAKEEISTIINELAELIVKYCGGVIKTEILHKDKLENHLKQGS